jgi:uncharacterized protein YqhQ
MVAETMAQQEFCQDCNQKRDCRKIYEQLGDTKGPSVVVKVIIAFLLPLVIFIVSLAVFVEIFGSAISSQRAQTVLSAVLALLVTFVYMFMVRAINRRLRQTG